MIRVSLVKAFLASSTAAAPSSRASSTNFWGTLYPGEMTLTTMSHGGGWR